MNQLNPFLLLILDGVGISENKTFNAFSNAHTPHLERLLNNNPHCLLEAGGECVGLPKNQMGNSEVGHLSIGAGRIIPQSLTRIELELTNNAEKLKTLAEWKRMIASAKTNSTLHLWGLVSDGGVHSHQDHIISFIQAAKTEGIAHVYVHAVLDGRDTAPACAEKSLKTVEQALQANQYAPIVDIVGRFYAMDRDNRWNKIKQAWDMYIDPASARMSSDSISALAEVYAQGLTDEFSPCISMPHAPGLKAGDAWLFCNFRADRARQLTASMLPSKAKNFGEFDNSKLPDISVFTATKYSDDFDCVYLFPQKPPPNTLSEIFAARGINQFRVAETEKYAHVTYFFNGGIEASHKGEDRCLIPSADVRTYDLKPEMGAYEVTQKLCEAIESNNYPFLLCNLANGDMVGHTGNYEASIKAVEVLDECVGQILAAIDRVGGAMILTADHGNCEQMIDYNTQEKHTSHTTNLVPCIFAGAKSDHIKAQSNIGSLADIAPSILHLMGLPVAREMTGKKLFALKD